MFKFEMGNEVKDKITGFKGIVVARVEYITGCRQYAINDGKLTKEGRPQESIYFDEDRLELTGKSKKLETRSKGGPHEEPAGRI